MNRPVLFSIILSFLPPFTIAAPQMRPPASPKWTEAQKNALLNKARNGDVSSQFWLGSAFEQGWFGKANFQEAAKWLRRAANRGDADAQNAQGQMYEDGEGVPQNYAHAAKWYRMAAEHVPDLGGAGQGRNNLGLLYLNGLGFRKNYVQAYAWFRLAKAETNLSIVRPQMTQTQINQAEQIAEKWKGSHPER